MPGEKYTRCPGCSTVFRVRPEQLALRAGQVRCGQCKTVFDGIAQQVSLAPSIHTDTAPPSEAALGPPTLTLRDAQALGPPTEAPTVVRDPGPTPPSSMPQSDSGVWPASRPTTAAPKPGAAFAETPAGDRFAPPPTTSRRARILTYVIVVVVLVLLMAAQAAYHFRDSIVTFWPVTRPAFERVCEVGRCTIRPLRDAAMSYLSIDASDLQADPAHRGLLILTATLRNRAGWALAYPHLELTLTDAQDHVVVRRALAPADYAGGVTDLGQGIAANGEIALKVFIDASATSQAGYRLYMFYP